MAPVAYSGGLQPKKKAELQEIAQALHLSNTGTKEDIQNRIKKHLDQNQSLLEGNPVFSGLFGKRKRSVQPHFIHVRPVPSPASESTDEIIVDNSSSPTTSRSTRRGLALGPTHEVTPVPEAREVSMMLKNAPISPLEEEATTLVTENLAPHKEPSGTITSTPKSILRNVNVPKPSLELATTFQTLKVAAKQRARAYLLASRSTLSNSVNIWLITALFELLYIFYVVIPWKSIQFSSSRPGNLYLSIRYPPLTTFQSCAFWSVLAHWSIPALVIPAVLGSIVSFHPANATSARVPRMLPLDPLTASIIRLAAQYAYPYESLNATLQGLDVIGPRWRILNASVGVALAFAEAIFTAPGACSEARVRQRAGTPRRVTAPEDHLVTLGES
ncbi:hypothetical protein BS17DRAFT_789506 [Gyrodon lividus]|nr:hypothetical protein BS17DRAFT_789506 [Gyrodon lividus]